MKPGRRHFRRNRLRSRFSLGRSPPKDSGKETGKAEGGRSVCSQETAKPSAGDGRAAMKTVMVQKTGGLRPVARKLASLIPLFSRPTGPFVALFWRKGEDGRKSSASSLGFECGKRLISLREAVFRARFPLEWGKPALNRPPIGKSGRRGRWTGFQPSHRPDYPRCAGAC